MTGRIIFGALAILFFLGTPSISNAQTSTFRISIVRPGEGETIYTGQGAPYVTVPVTGYVTDASGAVQVKLELFQNARPEGSLTTTPDKTGKYWFDVAINSNNPDDHPVSECADGVCHILSRLGFPPGHVLVRVTATDSAGHTAIAERNVIVDQSGSANVPVQLITANGAPIPPSLNVTAQTRIYDWRLRQYIASPDANGRVLFNIERLAEAPTRYVFRLDPTIINGTQYFSRTPAQLTLTPTTSINEPVKLMIETRRGQINVMLNAQNKPVATPLSVRAIELPSGRTHTAESTNGNVVLNNLPIGNYLLAIDDEQAARQGLHAPTRTIDLTEQPITSTELSLVPITRTLRGVVRDSEGQPLPLGWLAAEEAGKSIRVSPVNGEFVARNFPENGNSLWVIAPGYFRRAVSLDAEYLDVKLTREPNTRLVPWGTGTITLPPETLATANGNVITLQRGWLWGRGTGVFTLTTPYAEIKLTDGTFAIESLLDAPSWLYVVDGTAKVTLSDNSTPIEMNTGEMLAFGNGIEHPEPVALDSNVVRLLHAGGPSPVRIETEPAYLARLQDEFARRGISIKLLTLSIIGLILLGIGVVMMRRQRRQSN